MKFQHVATPCFLSIVKKRVLGTQVLMKLTRMGELSSLHSLWIIVYFPREYGHLGGGGSCQLVCRDDPHVRRPSTGVLVYHVPPVLSYPLWAISRRNQPVACVWSATSRRPISPFFYLVVDKSSHNSDILKLCSDRQDRWLYTKSNDSQIWHSHISYYDSNIQIYIFTLSCLILPS